MYVEQSPVPGKCPGPIRGLCTHEVGLRPRISPAHNPDFPL